MKNKGLEWLSKRQWIVVVLALVVVLRIPSLFEPYWYGDEAIYLTIGQAINKGIPLYSGIHDNKPPLLYVLAAMAGGNQFWFKFIAMGWNLVTILVFVKLAEKVFEHRKKTIIIATAAFSVLTTIPLWEGNIANAELFFLLPTILAVYWLWHRPTAYKNVLAAGVAIGVAALFKIPAGLEALVWPLVWTATREKDWFKKTILLGGGAAIPIFLSGLYFGLSGNLKEYLVAAWVQNIPYLSSWSVTGGGAGFMSLKVRAVIACLSLLGIWGFAKKMGRTSLIIISWATITLFASTLSSRPYPHYLMQLSGVAAIAFGMLWEKKQLERWLATSIFVAILGAYGIFRFYVYPVGSYYTNFMSWVWKMQTTEKYYSWFGDQVNANYQIASLIKSESGVDEKIFVWGDQPVIYALAHRLPQGKYTAKYHVKDFKAETITMADLKKNPPTFIVSYGDETGLPGLTRFLETNYLLEKKVKNISVYRWTRLSSVISRL